MSEPSDSGRAPAPTSPLDAANLEGHTIEELSDYLDRGRTPPDRAVDASAGAQNALAALARLRSFAPRILESEAETADVSDHSWIKRILEQIGVQAHAGRDIPISHVNPNARLAISEGAVRALIRAAGDEIDGFIVERTALNGDIETPGAATTVTVEVSLVAGTDRDSLIGDFRRTVLGRIRAHTQLRIETVTVEVRTDDVPEEDDK